MTTRSFRPPTPSPPRFGQEAAFSSRNSLLPNSLRRSALLATCPHIGQEARDQRSGLKKSEANRRCVCAKLAGRNAIHFERLLAPGERGCVSAPSRDHAPTPSGHNSVQTPKSALLPENPPQEAISLFGPLWGGVAEDARPSRFLPLWANSPFGPLWFPRDIGYLVVSS
jgi:hypothetical protein